MFAVFPDGELWNRYWDGDELARVGVARRRAEPAPARGVVVVADRIDVWAPGRDGRTWHRWWDGTRWVDWEQLPA